jgi:hypothetical protein
MRLLYTGQGSKRLQKCPIPGAPRWIAVKEEEEE